MFSVLIPAFVRRLDRYLLVHAPVVHGSAIHLLLYFSIHTTLLSLLVCLVIEIEISSVEVAASFLRIVFAISAIVWCLWIVYQARGWAFHPVRKRSVGYQAAVCVVYAACCLVAFLPSVVCSEVIRARLEVVIDPEEFMGDMRYIIAVEAAASTHLDIYYALKSRVYLDIDAPVDPNFHGLGLLLEKYGFPDGGELLGELVFPLDQVLPGSDEDRFMSERRGLRSRLRAIEALFGVHALDAWSAFPAAIVMTLCIRSFVLLGPGSVFIAFCAVYIGALALVFALNWIESIEFSFISEDFTFIFLVAAVSVLLLLSSFAVVRVPWLVRKDRRTEVAIAVALFFCIAALVSILGVVPDLTGTFFEHRPLMIVVRSMIAALVFSVFFGIIERYRALPR